MFKGSDKNPGYSDLEIVFSNRSIQFLWYLAA